MAFTSRLGTVDSRLANLELGYVAPAGGGGPASDLTGTVALRGLQVSGTLQSVNTLSGNVGLRGLQVSGTLQSSTSLSGTVALRGLQVAGTLESINTLSGNVVLRGLQVSGTLVPPPAADLSGTVILRGLQVAGTLASENTLSGTVRLRGLQVAGVLVGPSLPPGIGVATVLQTPTPGSALAILVQAVPVGTTDAYFGTARFGISTFGSRAAPPVGTAVYQLPIGTAVGVS